VGDLLAELREGHAAQLEPDVAVATESDVVVGYGLVAVEMPAVVARAAARKNTTDAGNAEVFVAAYGDQVRYDHARGRWLVWDGHRWRPDGDGAAQRMALEVARLRYAAAGTDALDEKARKILAKHAIASESAPRLDATLKLARTMRPIADDGEGWDEVPGLLGVPNGVVDLWAGELRDGRPDDRITMQTAVRYEPDAACPRFERFLREVLEDSDEVAPWLQRLLGYSITGEGTLHMLVFLMGRGGNGKGALIRILQTVLGDYAHVISAKAFDAYSNGAHTTEVADLAGARFAYCEELGGGRLNAGRMKDVSGGGRKIARRMRADTFEFRQTWQLFFTTNDLPRSDDNSWGWWRRVHAVDFPRRFDDEAAGRELEAALADEAEGILAWLVRGAHEWYSHGLGETPEAVAEKTAQYREDVDPLETLFEAGVLVTDPEAVTPFSVLFDAYSSWSNGRDLGIVGRMNEAAFGTALRGRFEQKRIKIDGQQARAYVGVRGGEAT
jgi:putative DNA primase/helicase